MNEIESLINSLRAMELPKGAESILGAVLSKANALETDRDGLKKAFDKREEDNKTARDEIKGLKVKVTELEGAAPNAEVLKTYEALGKPEDLKTRLEQASADRQTAVSAGNEKALSLLGISADALELKKLDGAVLNAKKDGDKVTATVKQGETESAWADFVKEKNLEGTLKNFVVQSSGVPVLGQTIGDKAGPQTVEQRTTEKQQSGDYSL